jgi:hypothetical protein
VTAEDDAEGMTDGVGKDPEARFAFTRDRGGAAGKQFVLAHADITHADAAPT